MTSLKQTIANKINSLRSSGPRSPEGRLISSMNALKHGLSRLGVRPPAAMAEAYGKPAAIGHGSDPIMSFNMFLFPDDCRLDLTEPEKLNTYEGLTVRGSTGVALGDVTGHIYFDTLDLAPNGVMGDVSTFSAEAGGKLLEHVVEKGVEFVTVFKAHDTRIA